MCVNYMKIQISLSFSYLIAFLIYYSLVIEAFYQELSNIKKEIDPEGTSEEGGDDDKTAAEKAPHPSVEAKIVNGVLDQIPGVKKIRDIKKKAEKVKKLIE